MQRGVALEDLCNRGSSFGTDTVALKTAGMGFGGAWCGVSMGADTKVNALELVRVLSSLLQRLQCGVALESLGDSGYSCTAESVFPETASMGAGRVLRAVNGR